MPKEVQIIEVKAEIQYRQQTDVGNLFAHGDFFAKQKQRHQNQSEHTAVDIRQNIRTAAADRRLIRRQMIGEKIKYSKVLFIGCGGGAACGRTVA